MKVLEVMMKMAQIVQNQLQDKIRNHQNHKHKAWQHNLIQRIGQVDRLDGDGEDLEDAETIDLIVLGVINAKEFGHGEEFVYQDGDNLYYLIL